VILPRLRWGILGTASIAIRRVIPALQASSRAKLVAIASRDQQRASDVAAAAGIPRAFGSYERLLDDPAIDAVYIPLPNHLHVPWSVRTLAAGKHVLCEKPIGLNAADAATLVTAAQAHPRLGLVEAFMYRCHPRWEMMRTLVRDGAIGTLGTIHTVFSYENRNPGDIRNAPGMGGGAWLDIGCYGVSVARFLFEREPREVRGVAQIDPVLGIDQLTSAMMDFAPGTATVSCATQLAPHQSVVVQGSTARLELDLPFNPPSDQPTNIRITRKDVTRDIVIEPCNQFVRQADRFAETALDGAPPVISLADSLANMAVLDAVPVPGSGMRIGAG
jgi:predicted dehydrogenase